MAVSTHATKPVLLSPKGAQGGFSGFAHLGHRALSGVTSVVRTLQMARMVSTLANMSDAQLAALDITRADIRHHANRLMARDAG